MSQFRFTRLGLYSLKREYGAPGTVQSVQSTPDLETGRQSVTRRTFDIDRIIVLPETLTRKFKYDRQYIASGKDFTHGATFETGQRTFIIDVEDLPDDWEFHLEDYVIFKNQRYSIKKFELVEDALSWLIVGNEVKGQQPFNVIVLSAGSKLNLNDVAGGQL